MVSKLEKEVRKRDNSKFIVKEISKSISKAISTKLNAKRKTIEHYVRVKRNGFESYTDYKKHLAKECGFENYQSYLDYLAKEKGYSSNLERQKANANARNLRLNRNYFSMKQQIRRTILNEFEEKIVEYSENIFPKGEEINLEEIELKLDIEQLLGHLDKRSRKIIEEVHFYGESLTDVGKKLSLSRERIRQIEQKSLEQLREIGIKIRLNSYLF